MTQREIDTHKEWPELTIIEYYILVALIRVPHHGIGIFEEVARRTNQHIILLPGTLYSALKRMFEAGLIEVADPPHETQRADDRRKFYQLTESGRQKVDQFVTWMETDAPMTRADLNSLIQEQSDTSSSKEEKMKHSEEGQPKRLEHPAMRFKPS